MNRIGTGTRKSKATTWSMERYMTQTVSIPASEWSVVSRRYQAKVVMTGSRWWVKNGAVVDWSSSLDTIDTITLTQASELAMPYYTIRLSNIALQPQTTTTITITATFDDTYTSTTSNYVNDSYHALTINNENFNVFATLLPSIDETYINVGQASDTTLSIYISNPRAYNLEILYAGISVSDSDQSTLEFDLSDLITTELEAGSQDEAVFYIDMDDYTGCNISDYSIELEIGGQGIKTYYFIQET